jgi:hypothetical protein
VNCLRVPQTLLIERSFGMFRGLTLEMTLLQLEIVLNENFSNYVKKLKKLIEDVPNQLHYYKSRSNFLKKIALLLHRTLVLSKEGL